MKKQYFFFFLALLLLHITMPYRAFAGEAPTTPLIFIPGYAAFVSYLGTFAGDPKITIIQWGNGAPPLGTPSEIVWTNQTNYPVYHDAFFFNPDVAAFVVSTLTGK
jgi:hypothetical protein